MIKHSPGPWHGVDGPNGSAYVIAGKTRVVATLSAHPTPGLVKANARVLAAAPELLASLRELHDWMREHTTAAESLEMLTRSHAALAKAEPVWPV